MNERNWNYKGVQMSNKDNPYNFQITNVVNEVVYEADLFTNTNTEGVYSGNVMPGARYFEFTGVIYGTKEEKETAYKILKGIIRSEDFPSFDNRGFHELTWQDKRGEDVKIQAKVWKPLKTTEARNQMLEFTFTLLADNPLYLSQEQFEETGGAGILGGNEMPNEMPNSLDQSAGDIVLDNLGDKRAGMLIEITGEAVNPRITNMTTGQSLKILATTNLLQIDNRDKPFKITDESISIKDSKRGEYIYLAPGENNIVISLENFVDFESVHVKITFNSVFE